MVTCNSMLVRKEPRDQEIFRLFELVVLIFLVKICLRMFSFSDSHFHFMSLDATEYTDVE